MMVVTIFLTRSSIVCVDSMKKIDTNPDRTRSDSRHSRPEILGFPKREQEWRSTEPGSGLSAVSAVSAARHFAVRLNPEISR